MHAQTAGYTQRHAQTRLPLVRDDSTRSRSFLLTFKTVAFSCSLFLVGFPLSKSIIPDAQEHFLTPSARRHTHLFVGLGFSGIPPNPTPNAK